MMNKFGKALIRIMLVLLAIGIILHCIKGDTLEMIWYAIMLVSTELLMIINHLSDIKILLAKHELVSLRRDIQEAERMNKTLKESKE